MAANSDNPINRSHGKVWATSLMVVFLCLACQDERSKTESAGGTTSAGISQRESTHELLRLTIDNDQLRKYFHPGYPGRDTLFVVVDEIVVDEMASEHETPALVVTTECQTENCLRIESIKMTDRVAHVSLHYPIEGLRGVFVYDTANGGWELRDFELNEE